MSYDPDNLNLSPTEHTLELAREELRGALAAAIRAEEAMYRAEDAEREVREQRAIVRKLLIPVALLSAAGAACGLAALLLALGVGK